MTIVQLLGEDHGETFQKTRELEELLTGLCYEGKASLGKNLRKARELTDYFNHELKKHMGVEEKTTFPFLAAHLPKLATLISLLCTGHEEVRKNLRAFEFWIRQLAREKNSLRRGPLIEKARERGIYLIHHLENHFEEETEILYRVADQELRLKEKRELLKRVRPESNGRRKSHGLSPARFLA